MIEVKAHLYTFLTTDPTLVGFVSTRVYPSLAPATALLPYITYARIGYLEEKHLTGSSPQAREAYQFDAWGSSVQSQEDVTQAG